MIWQELATINLTYDWQFIPLTPTDTYESFRLSHFNWALCRGGFLIGRFYESPPSFYAVRRLYPTKELRIVKIIYPTDYILDLTEPRGLALKLSPRATVYAYDWRVKIERPADNPLLTDAQQLRIIRVDLATIKTKLGNTLVVPRTNISTQFDDPDSSSHLGII